jgi:hypothetical protein
MPAALLAAPMIEVVRDRLRLRFVRRDEAEAAVDSRGEESTAPEVEFVAYADDCRLYGHIRLSGDRLTDMLNHYEEFVLVDVLAESLSDGSVVETKEIVVRRDELVAVEASGPRGRSERRVRTRPHPMGLKAGPYLVEGYLHTTPGVDPVASIRRRGAMVPLTDARIAYVSGGLRHLREAVTVLVNRDHTDWILPAAEDDRIAFPDVPVAIEKGPLLKDFTGQLWGIEPA